MIRSVALATALVIAPLAACAPLQAGVALAQGVSTDVAAAPAGAYALDPTHTSVVWRVRHLGVTMYTARFDKAAGTVNLDPRDPTKSSVDVTVDIASVSTGHRDAQGEASFDKKIADTLGVAGTPQARFVSTAVTRTSATTGTVTGNLTLNGQTKPLTLNVTFGGGRTHPFAQRYVVGFSATGAFKRSDFGITQWAGSVGDEVTLLIESEMIKTP